MHITLYVKKILFLLITNFNNNFMKKLKLFIAALALLGGVNFANADDVFKDVTSTYLTNADFEGEYTVYNNPSSDRAIYQPKGWTIAYTNGNSNDLTALNSSCLQWNNFSGKAQLAVGGNNTYWVRLRWGKGAILELSQTVTLPEGSYRLTAAYYKNGTGGDGFILVNSTEKNANGNEDVWKSVDVDFTSDGVNETKIGCKAKHTDEYEKFLAFDNFVLEWNVTKALAALIEKATEVYNEDTSNTTLGDAIDAANNVKDSQNLEELESAYNNLKSVADLAINRKAWKEAKDAAEDALSNDDYSIVTGKEKADLQAEIGKEEPQNAEGYDEAASALATATQTFIDAKPSYELFTTYNIDLAYAASSKKPVITNETTAASLITALRAYYESHALAEGVEGAVDYTSAVSAANADTNTGWTNGIGTNQGQGYTDAEGNVASKYLDGGWANNTGANIDMTRSVEIPAGKYLLTVTARGADALDVYTLSIGGETVNLPKNGSSSGLFNNGWDDVSVEFDADGTTQTLEVIANSTAYYQWISINRFRLVQLSFNSDAYANSSEDYLDLNTAIENAEARTLGFEEGEYAPYINSVVLKALAEAKAMDKTAQNTNLKTTISSLTATLNNEENWVANTEEVNAVNTALFTTGDVTGTGWTCSVSWSQVKEGVFSTSSGTFTYGELTGFTMPLKADTYYKLTFNHRAWDSANSENGGTVSVLCGEDGLAATQFAGQGTSTSPKSETFYFKTGAAGNYVFTLNASSGRPTFGGVTIVKAVTVDVDEEATEAPTAGSYEIATLKRTLSADYWNTFSVPFDMDIPEGWTVKEFASAEGNVINFKDAESIVAGNPYLVKPTADAVNPTFNGVIVKATEGETMGTSDYKFAAQIYNKSLATDGTVAYLSTNGTIKKLTSGGIKGLRAYFIIPAEGNARIAFIDGDQTGIMDTVREATNDNRVYDLQGRQVKAVKKGIYVVNGKKVIK